jgi:hypothetical protein
MTALYNAQENCIVELPGMEKPDFDDRPRGDASVHDRDEWMQVVHQRNRDYSAHIASLRKLPCDPSCRTVWKEGQEVVEGKDYEVKECRTWTKRDDQGWGCAECCNKDAGCDEDCDASYYRPKCPFCKGKGWFKEQPLFAFPIQQVSAPLPTDDAIRKEAEEWYPYLKEDKSASPCTLNQIYSWQRDAHISCAQKYQGRIKELEAEVAELRGAMILLNKEVDDYWNHGGGDVRAKRITAAQKQCAIALKIN